MRWKSSSRTRSARALDDGAAVRYATASVLARYQIIRGTRPADQPLPAGRRIDTRKHTKHVLRPEPEMVEALIDDARQSATGEASGAAFQRFSKAYLALLETRFELDRAPFDALSRLAQEQDVYLGCNCPTSFNPDVRHCHTALALKFMKRKYPSLKVKEP